MSDTTANTRAIGAVGDAAYGQAEHSLPRAVREGSGLYRTRLPIGGGRQCGCKPNHLNCLTAKEWLKSQLGVWQFNYQGRDIRDKKVHPATFPISLATRLIELFTHEGELVLDPFVGSGTTMVAAQDTNRSAVGFDLHAGYVDLSESRLGGAGLFTSTAQVAVHDDASSVAEYLEPGQRVAGPHVAALREPAEQAEAEQVAPRPQERAAGHGRAVLPGPARPGHHAAGGVLGGHRRHLRRGCGRS